MNTDLTSSRLFLSSVDEFGDNENRKLQMVEEELSAATFEPMKPTRTDCNLNGCV